MSAGREYKLPVIFLSKTHSGNSKLQSIIAIPSSDNSCHALQFLMIDAFLYPILCPNVCTTDKHPGPPSLYALDSEGIRRENSIRISFLPYSSELLVLFSILEVAVPNLVQVKFAPGPP